MNTRKNIINASFALFEERPFNRITVEDILARAEVSRGTFYKYFNDKYELMNLYYGHTIEATILQRYNGSNWDELQALCFRFAYDHRTFFRNLKNTSAEGDFRVFLTNFSFKIFEKIRLANVHREKLTDLERYTINSFLTSAIYLFGELSLENCPLKPQEASAIATQQLPREYKVLSEPLAVPNDFLFSKSKTETV